MAPITAGDAKKRKYRNKKPDNTEQYYQGRKFLFAVPPCLMAGHITIPLFTLTRLANRFIQSLFIRKNDPGTVIQLPLEAIYFSLGIYHV